MFSFYLLLIYHVAVGAVDLVSIYNNVTDN